MRLIRTFEPFIDESGVGYYRRLSSANGLAGVRELARLCEVSTGKSALLVNPEHVARMLGINPEWARRATERDEVAKVWRSLRRRSDAVCVDCLRESVYVKACWEHAYVIACLKHRVLLTDRCPACSEQLSERRELIEQCPCGYDLRLSPSSPARPAQVWLGCLIGSDGTSCGGLQPPVHNVSVDVLGLVIRALCSLWNPDSGQRQNAYAPRTVSESCTFLEPLDALLADWPEGFHAHVRLRLERGNPDGRTLNTRLGKWYAILAAHCVENSLSCFLAEVGRVASQETDLLLGLDSASAVTNVDADHILVAEAARRIGVSRGALAQFVKDGRIPSVQKRFGTRGTAYLVAVDDVVQVCEQRKEWASAQDACSHLDVPPSVLSKLAEAGLVIEAKDWRTDVRKGGPYNVKSVLVLAGKLLGACGKQHVQGGPRIALRQLTSRRSGDQRALVAALRAIAEGQILPLNQPSTAGALEYSLQEVGQFFSRPVLEAGLSVQGLAKLTGWKWESIDHWIELGLLRASTITLRGQAARVVAPGDILAFLRTFIPASDLARELGTKPSALTARLGAEHIHGALLLPSGQRRGGLVRVKDLARLALRE